jgi:DNA-binding LytR/AlgR family response regulator
MEPIKNILVIEDESIVSKDIQMSLKRLGYAICGSGSTGEEAIDLANEKKPDLILMDIMLKGKLNGIETAHIIRESLDVPIIYLTAYADESTLSKAKITEPYGYIIKPFQEIDLHTSIEMALYKHGKELEKKKEVEMLFSAIESGDKEGVLFVRSKSSLVKIKADDIIFVEALKDYVSIFTPKAKYVIHSTMKDIEKKLPSGAFLRVHRSYIVRLDKIASIEHTFLTMENTEKQVPIGGNYKEALFNKIKTI